MLAVQKYLLESFPDLLEEQYGIRSTKHPTLPLRLFNYSQISDQKTHPIVRECRALCLEEGSWLVVGRSFPRFYNKGEQTGLPFDWDGPMQVQEKVDGSLMQLFRYGSQWIVTTKKSFADACPNGHNQTWSELFHQELPAERYQSANPAITYVFEYCSPYTQVVHYHEKPKLYLLTAFYTASGIEVDSDHLDLIAQDWRVLRPMQFRFDSLNDLHEYLNARTSIGPTFEGFVLRDKDGNRLKVKSESYKRLHKMYNNGHVHSLKSVLGLVLDNSVHEALKTFPSLLPLYFQVQERLNGLMGKVNAVFAYSRSLPTQKEFAEFVLRHCPEASFLLFMARKSGNMPGFYLKQFEDKIADLISGDK